MKTAKSYSIIYATQLLLLLFMGVFAAFHSNWGMVAICSLVIGACVYQHQNLFNLLSQLAEQNSTSLHLPYRSENDRNPLEFLSRQQEQIIQRYQLSSSLLLNWEGDLKEADHLPVDDPFRIGIAKIHDKMASTKRIEAEQTWISQGVASLGEVLRNKADEKVYLNRILSFIINYVGANQGGFYVLQEEKSGQRYMDLKACYAYGRTKHEEKRIEEGQGILGQSMLEKEFVFITEIPRDYVKITSGLGEATPRNIAIIPIIYNNVFYGVMELASFSPMTEHQKVFLKKAGENVAGEMASLSYLNHTKKLLEESHLLTNELQSREQVMRQNMEELTATQEQMARKQSELAGVWNAINTTMATAEFNLQGKLIHYNSELQSIFQWSTEDLATKDFTIIVGEHADITFESVLVDKQQRGGDYLTKRADGKEIWINTSFTVIHAPDGSADRLLILFQDITSKKVKEQEFERLSLVANNTDNAVLITDKDGLTEFVNAGFTKMTGYRADEIIGKKPGHLLQGEESSKETIQRIREMLSQRLPIYEEILNYNKKGEPYWVSLVINPIFNEQGALDKYISVQANITETKKSSLDLKYKLEAISRSNSIIEFDQDGNILDANENFLQIMEYNLEEVKGKHHRIFLLEDDKDKSHYDSFWQKLKDGNYINSEFKRKTKSGKTIWLRGIYNPIFDMNGRLKKVVKFVTQITEEKRLQVLTEKKQRELNSYLEGVNNTIASAEFDPTGHFKDANQIFFTLMGYSREELAGQHADIIMKQDTAFHLMWENLRLGKFFSGEFKMKNKVGKELWLNGTFNPICIDSEVPAKIMMFAQFTTQEKEKLQELNYMASALKSTLPVLELNANLTCKTASDKFMKLMGITRLSLKDKTLLDFIDPCFIETWKAHQDTLLQTEFNSINLPLRIGHQTKNYEVSISVARNLEGNVNRIILLLVKELDHRLPILVAV